jgi:hypothetical protein
MPGNPSPFSRITLVISSEKTAWRLKQYFESVIVFKLQYFISELRIRVFLENGLGSSQAFLIL